MFIDAVKLYRDLVKVSSLVGALQKALAEQDGAALVQAQKDLFGIVSSF